MATFGVALRATSSALLTNAQSGAPSGSNSSSNSNNSSAATSASPQLAVKEPQAPLDLLACPMSLHADAIQLFCAIYDIPIIRRDFNPLNGVPVPAPANCPNSPSSATSLSSLPRLQDGPTVVVHGWITILKYLAWKFLSNKDNTFYPTVTATSFASSNTSTTPTAFAIDSFLSTLEPLQAAIEALVQHQLYAFAAAGHRGSISYLRHRFDKDGGRLIPQWQQPHNPKVSSATHNAANSHHHQQTNHLHPKPGTAAAAHAHHAGGAHSQSVMHAHAPSQDHSRESAQFLFERNLRSLRTHLAEVQNALAARNPNLTLDASIKYLRRFEEGSVAAAASTDIEFAYALGSSRPTLADYVLFILLNELTMLHTFLPLIQPSNSAPLYIFTDKISAWCGTKLYDIVGPTSGISPKKSLWVSRHPILALASLTAASASTANASKKDEEKEESTSSEFSVSVSAPSANSTTTAPSTPSQTQQPPASPSPSSQQQSTLSAPTRSLPVPRLTSVSSVVDNRNAASSLAVEEVPDLMDYVERIAVRARAATPAGEFPAAPASPAPLSTSTSGGSTSSSTTNTTTATATGSTSSSSNSTIPRKLSTLGCSRELTQRLLDTVDSASINWKTVSDKSGIRLLTPLADSTSADHVSYRSMASTSFPVSPSILMAFLWSLDCYKLLDPNQVMDSRELAPHPNCQRAKYSYISVEMKSSSQTSANTTGARRESTDPSPAAPNVAPAAAAAITKVSSARFDFLLLNVWSKLLDGTYILLQQSVPDESEVNAPKKWSKGCIRASLGGCSLNNDEPLSGWVIRPYYAGDGTSPMCSVTFVQSIEFPARVGSWVSGELEKRTVATLSALRSRMKSLMGSHPLVQLAGGLESRARDATIHFRLSQAVPVSLANAVSGHGVQTTPHPKAK